MMKDLGPAIFFLGIEFIKTSTGYFLSQSCYALSILKKLNMEHAKLVSNPCSFSETTHHTTLSVNPTLYRSTVGALQYLILTRPDISFVVNRVCQTMHDPPPLDWLRVKHLLQYLKGTISDNHFYSNLSTFSLEVFSDADWASSSLDQRFTLAYLVFLGRNLVSWSSQRQKTIVQSNTEAKYKVVDDATLELIWIKSLLHELHFHLPSTPALWCKNIGATYLAANHVFHARTKHVVIYYRFIHEQVNSQQLRIGYLSTKDQAINILTKSLPKYHFLQLKIRLTICPTLSLRQGIETFIQIEDSSGSTARTNSSLLTKK